MSHEARTLEIVADGLTAEVSTLGAELRTLRDAEGRDLEWEGDPAVWAGRAPILFPIIGMLRDGRYRLDGREYAMPKHGIARHALFEVVSHATDRVALRLAANDTTRTVYPFDFALEVAYAVVGATLSVTATIFNDDTVPMPASLGFHPAFRWPLPYGHPRAEHAIVFEHDEPAPIRQLDPDGLLRPDRLATPVVGDTLALRDDLFDDDALIFDALASRRVRYGATAGPHVEVRFDDFTTLGVWSKPGRAGFVCIEPWQGAADPVGFDGDLFAKPGIAVVAPGAARAFTMTIALVADGG